MIWNIVSLRSSLQSLLGQKPAKTAEPDHQQVERVRRAMVGSLQKAGPEGFEHVIKRLEQAKDIEALWFLRADLMAALSALEDEAAARNTMARITPLFSGLLPASLNSRPSPLGGA
jgi:hypothetical protein